MLENGKNERVKFDKNVIQKAVEVRIKMAKKEAEKEKTVKNHVLG